MIQSPSLSTISMVPAAGELPLPVLQEGAELADFSTFLAQSGTLSAAPIKGETTALPQPEIPAAALAEAAAGGKHLPVGLPLALPVAEPGRPVTTPRPGPDTPDPIALTPVTALPLARSGVPVQPLDDPAQGKALPDPGTPESGEPGATALIDIDLVAAPPQPQPAAPTLAPVQSAPAALPARPDLPEAEAPPRRGSAPQPAAAALEHAAPQAAFLRQTFPAPRGPEHGAPLVPQAAQPASSQPAAAAPQPIAQVRIEVAPAVAVMRALPKEEVRPAPSALSAELPTTQLATSAPGASTTPVALAHQPIPLAERPQDFSALIDRLVAAREGAGPQAVAVSVAHADFGRVNLRFRHDETGLSVAMASADPAFARAASAMPPVLPVSDAQSGQLQNGQRQEGSAAPGQSGTGQQRGSTGERQGDQPHGNASRRQSHHDHSGPARPQRRAGIFA